MISAVQMKRLLLPLLLMLLLMLLLLVALFRVRIAVEIQMSVQMNAEHCQMRPSSNNSPSCLDSASSLVGHAA